MNSGNQDLKNKQESTEKILKELADVKYALDQSSIVAITDEEGKIIHANDYFCDISKYSVEELLGQDHKILNSGYHSKDFFKQMWETIRSGQVWKGELRNRAKDGSYYWVLTTIVPVLNTEGQPYQYVSIRKDITLRKQMEEELSKSEEKYRLITENSSDLIVTIDYSGELTYVSPSCINILEPDEQELQLNNVYKWLNNEDGQRLKVEIDAMFAKIKTSAQIEFEIQRRNGKHIDAEARINPISDQNGNIHSLVLVIRDLSERKRSERIIYNLSHHDSLTHLPNRRFFIDYLNKAIQQADKDKKKLGIMLIDVDKFKYINDSEGHEIGDLILIEVAKRLEKCLRSADVVARVGGDEFTTLLSNISSTEDVEKVAARIVESFHEPITIAGHSYHLSCSIGISIFPFNGTQLEELLKRADIALHASKENGRDGFLIFQSEMEKRSLERIVIENELRKAIEQQQFSIEYQPKKDLLTGNLVGMEALVRWEHPELGKILPNKFIPIAEETGLIIPLGEWVLRKACIQNKEWQDKGYLPVKVSVNLSTRQFHSPNLPETIESILNETNLDAKWLELEITESVLADLDYSAHVLRKIGELGVHVSIDDFGTGYSSFSYLKYLPVGTLKIDASFIKDIHLNKESKAIVKGIVDIAKTLNLNVIAEGIENEQQLHELSENGCIQGQGFLFSRPLTKQSFETYLQEATKN